MTTNNHLTKFKVQITKIETNTYERTVAPLKSEKPTEVKDGSYGRGGVVYEKEYHPPQKEEFTKEESSTIFEQTVTTLDLPAVIKTINGI